MIRSNGQIFKTIIDTKHMKPVLSHMTSEGSSETAQHICSLARAFGGRTQKMLMLLKAQRKQNATPCSSYGICECTKTERLNIQKLSSLMIITGA